MGLFSEFVSLEQEFSHDKKCKAVWMVSSQIHLMACVYSNHNSGGLWGTTLVESVQEKIRRGSRSLCLKEHLTPMDCKAMCNVPLSINLSTFGARLFLWKSKSFYSGCLKVLLELGTSLVFLQIFQTVSSYTLWAVLVLFICTIHNKVLNCWQANKKRDPWSGPSSYLISILPPRQGKNQALVYSFLLQNPTLLLHHTPTLPQLQHVCRLKEEPVFHNNRILYAK